MFELSLLSAAK